MIIYLIGYMAAGKTTYGKQVANRLKMKFIDTDEFIEHKFSMSVNELFKDMGERNFRELERSALEEVSENDGVVIATGGGLPCHCNNMDFIKKHGTSIYLKASPALLASRLETVKHSRPLLKDKSNEELRASVTEMLEKREPFYERADIIIDAEGTKVPDIIMLAFRPYMSEQRN